jgi:hypothetical protein
MHIYSKTLLPFACAILLFSACDKEKIEAKKDKTTPVVTLNAPTDLQFYKSVDTVFIKGTATDNAMHSLYLEIKDDSTGTVYYTETPYVHDLSSYDINFFWKINVSRNTKATVSVAVEDHNNHVGVARKNITISK